MTTKFNPKHWTNDYLVFAAPKDRQSLAIMRNCESGDVAISKFNARKANKKRKLKATHAVRITTLAGTKAQLKAAGWTPPKPKKKVKR